MNPFGVSQLLPVVLLASIVLLDFVLGQQKDYYKILGEFRA